MVAAAALHAIEESTVVLGGDLRSTSVLLAFAVFFGSEPFMLLNLPDDTHHTGFALHDCF